MVATIDMAYPLSVSLPTPGSSYMVLPHVSSRIIVFSSEDMYGYTADCPTATIP